jgi:tetratricopeptide (TPR) repeat protein
MRFSKDTTARISAFLLGLLLMGCASLVGPDVKPGIVLFEAGNYGASLDHYETIIKAGKANANVYRLAYESAFKAGKRATAGKYYTEAIKAGYDSDSLVSLATTLWYERALSTMGSDDWKEARKAASQIADLAADSPQDKFCTLILAGKLKYDRGAHKGLWDAISDYSMAANYDKSSGLPFFLMGQARYKNNRTDYDAALEDYYEALRIEPDGTFLKQAKADIKKIEAVKKKMNAFWGK